MSKEFKDLLKLKEICHVMTDRTKWRSIKDELNSPCVRTGDVVSCRRLSKGCWAEAINTAGFISNHPITSTTLLMIWQSTAHIPDDQQKKLDKKAENVRFIRYADCQKGYHFLSADK